MKNIMTLCWTTLFFVAAGAGSVTPAHADQMPQARGCDSVQVNH